MDLPQTVRSTMTALTIAGFDPSSGAGITADLLTFAAHGVFATSAITAQTVQSTQGVTGVHAMAPSVLRETLECLEDDLPPAGIKIGMLGSSAATEVVADYLRQVRSRRSVLVVLDPVLRASSGASLLETGDATLLHGLLSLVDTVTPNLAEIAQLTGMPCTTTQDMERCAAELRGRHAGLQVVVTGGHLAQPVDLLLGEDGAQWFSGEHVETTSTHGTGCAFSTALLCARMQGATWAEATASAKRFVTAAMRTAIPRGQGCGPMALLPQLAALVV